MRTPARGGNSARGRAAAALAVFLILLSAAPAAAGVPPLPDPVQDVVETVDDVVSSDDPIGDTVDAVDDVAGDVTGTEDPIQGTVDDVTDKADEVADDVGETADDVVDGVTGTVDDVVDRVDDATGGTIGDVIGGGQGNGGPSNGPGGDDGSDGGFRGRSLSPDGEALPFLGGVGRRDGSNRSARGDGGAVSLTEETADRATEGISLQDDEPGLGERLREAAIDASKKLALPLALTVAVLGYLIAQYWADRKDPKLVFAPVDADHDLLSFQ